MKELIRIIFSVFIVCLVLWIAFHVTQDVVGGFLVVLGL